VGRKSSSECRGQAFKNIPDKCGTGRRGFLSVKEGRPCENKKILFLSRVSPLLGTLLYSVEIKSYDNAESSAE